MTTISTHVLDTATGRPAAGVPVALTRRGARGAWSEASRHETDDDGRVGDLLDGEDLTAAVYRLRFETEAYMEATGRASFYPWVDVVFRIDDPDDHHHVPLLLSPYGYSTYRGS